MFKQSITIILQSSLPFGLSETCFNMLHKAKHHLAKFENTLKSAIFVTNCVLTLYLVANSINRYYTVLYSKKTLGNASGENGGKE